MKTDKLLNKLESIEILLRTQTLNKKKVLNLDEVSTYTGLSKQYLYKLTSKNQIPFYKSNGKVIRFSKEEIDKWLLRNRQATEEEIEQEAINYSVLRNK